MEAWPEMVARIRQRPSMYIVSTGPVGVSNVLMEVVSNSFDFVLALTADQICVAVDSDGITSVWDNGPGYSVDISDDGRPFLERVFTEARSAPSADGHHPHVHLAVRLGLGPVCALCDYVEVTTTNALGTFRQTFSRGATTSALEAIAPAGPGTTVRYRLDPTIFRAGIVPRMEQVAPRLRTLAALVRGVTLDVNIAERIPPNDGLAPLFTEYFGDVDHPKRGFLRDETPDVPKGPLVIEYSSEVGDVEILLAFDQLPTRRNGQEIRAFCNYMETIEGGSPIAGLEQGLQGVFGDGASRVLNHVRGVIHIRMQNPEFSGPTRERLDSAEATGLVAGAIDTMLPPLLEARPQLRSALQSIAQAVGDPEGD